MAAQAVARETLCALRRDIARIEGRLPERLEPPPGTDMTVLRHGGMALRGGGLLATGVEAFDAALDGGLSRGGLSEIHAAQTRDAGASAGFTLALAALAMKERRQRSLLWIGTAEIFREAGLPYAAGLAQTFGISPRELLFADAPKLADALWIAEEATRLSALAAIVIELRGNPDRLDLTATRRLHRRAGDTGRPVFLIRQAAFAEPTAAPVRLVVSPTPAALRQTLTGLLEGSLGNPVFSVSIGKSRSAAGARFLMEWNRHDLAFQERQQAHPRHLVSLSRHGADMAAAPGAIMALETLSRRATAGHQPARKQHAAHRGA
jgi:protein ImuA